MTGGLEGGATDLILRARRTGKMLPSTLRIRCDSGAADQPALHWQL